MRKRRVGFSVPGEDWQLDRAIRGRARRRGGKVGEERREGKSALVVVVIVQEDRKEKKEEEQRSRGGGEPKGTPQLPIAWAAGVTREGRGPYWCLPCTSQPFFCAVAVVVVPTTFN